MRNFYLIDGYNLMHALGHFPTTVAHGSLRKARNILLAQIAHAHKHEECEVTVVFDAANAPLHLPSRIRFKNVLILFAVKHDEADDLIEERIRHDSSPKQLHVVSNDLRLRTAAKRRRCRVLTCDDYMDLIEKMAREQGRLETTQFDPDKSDEDEKEYWGAKFDHLNNDPDMKELFDPFQFDEFNLDEFDFEDFADGPT
ncbi:MAG: NYN domain-containing protein [Gemmataceae bacterium]